MERASFSNRDQTGVASTGWVIWAVKNSVSSSSILTASFVSASVAQTSAAGPPVGWLCYRWTLCELQVFTGTLILCAMLRIYWTFMFFCFSENPDGGLQKQTRPPQRHSDQRDSDQAPQQHPPQPPTRQLPDNGEQENSAPTAGFSTVFTPLLTHILRRQPLVHLLFFFLYVALRWFLNLTSTSLFLRGKV